MSSPTINLGCSILVVRFHMCYCALHIAGDASLVRFAPYRHRFHKPTNVSKITKFGQSICVQILDEVIAVYMFRKFWDLRVMVW